MRFLITNDDGFDAPGITALYRALRELGDVSVVAPRHEQSARGHAVTLRDAVAVEWMELAEFGRVGVVEGFPADCVRIGIAALGEDFDWIVSGVNRGANLGVDAFYSGTVAAAREATLLGYPAMAISQLVVSSHPEDWEQAESVTRQVVSDLMQRRRDPQSFWNVNLPALAGGGRPRTVRRVRLCTDAMPISYRISEDGRANRQLFRHTSVYTDRPAAPGTDVHAVFGGEVAVTPIHIDTTCPTHVGHRTPST